MARKALQAPVASRETEAQARTERAAVWARGALRNRCYWPGCTEPGGRVSVFCSAEHAQAWEALPTEEREVYRYAAHLHAGRILDEGALARLAQTAETEGVLAAARRRRTDG